MKPLWVFNVRTIGHTIPTMHEICKCLHGFVDEVSAVRHACSLKFDNTTIIKGHGVESDAKAIATCLETIGLGVILSVQENPK